MLSNSERFTTCSNRPLNFYWKQIQKEHLQLLACWTRGRRRWLTDERCEKVIYWPLGYMPRYNWCHQTTATEQSWKHTWNEHANGFLATVASFYLFLILSFCVLALSVPLFCRALGCYQEGITAVEHKVLPLPLFLSSLSLAHMHTSAIYRMQCHSRNSQIAPCSERGSCNINALLLHSLFYTPRCVALPDAHFNLPKSHSSTIPATLIFCLIYLLHSPLVNY